MIQHFLLYEMYQIFLLISLSFHYQNRLHLSATLPGASLCLTPHLPTRVCTMAVTTLFNLCTISPVRVAERLCGVRSIMLSLVHNRLTNLLLCPGGVVAPYHLSVDPFSHLQLGKMIRLLISSHSEGSMNR